MALNFLQKTLNKFEEYTFLDNGCGNGHDIAYLSFHLNNLIMHGIDISLKAVEDAIQLNSNKSNFTFECKNWKELNDTQHDLIYSSGVYQFFKFTEREAFISKIKKFLKTRGLFFLTTLSSNDKQYYGKSIPVKNDPNSFQGEYFLHFCPEEELRKDFEFLNIIDLFEYFHKNYARDTEYHTLWMLIGENKVDG